MTLYEATNLIENLAKQSINKTEIKVYKRFIYILNALNSRDFSKEEKQSIEEKLDSLKLESNPENKKTYFRKALRSFEKYLKDTFSLVPKGHYIGLGTGLGLSFGVVFGIVFLPNMERSMAVSLGIIAGMIVGHVIIGRYLENKATKEGRVL